MTPTPLENLVAVGKLHAAAHAPREIAALVRKSNGLLQDAQRAELSLESRFTLAYTAAHGFALAALWRCGYRSDDRYTVFATLVHTTSLNPVVQRVLVNAHRARNQMEYEADERVDQSLLDALLSATTALAGSVHG